MDSYWRTQMELLDDHPPLDLYDRSWVIHTRSEERAPARIGTDRQRPSEPHQPRLPHRRDRGALGALAGRARRPGSHRAGQRDHVRLPHPGGRRGRPRRSWTSTSRWAPTRSWAWVMTSRPPTRPSRPDSTRASPSWASGPPSRPGARIGRNVRIAEGVRTADFTSRTRAQRRQRGPPGGAGRAAPPGHRGGVTGANWTAPGLGPGEPSPGGASWVPAAWVDGWLAELALRPAERAERDGLTSWDLAPRRAATRREIRVTLILDPRARPGVLGPLRAAHRWVVPYQLSACCCAGTTSCRSSSSRISEDERPVLTAELPVATLDRDALGVALARLVSVCDLLLDESAPLARAPGPRKAAGPEASDRARRCWSATRSPG